MQEGTRLAFFGGTLTLDMIMLCWQLTDSDPVELPLFSKSTDFITNMNMYDNVMKHDKTRRDFMIRPRRRKFCDDLV